MNVRRRHEQGRQNLDETPTDEQPDGNTEYPQYQALDEHVLEKLQAVGAEGETNGQLVFPLRTSCKKQIGDVDRAEKHQQYDNRNEHLAVDSGVLPALFQVAHDPDGAPTIEFRPL